MGHSYSLQRIPSHRTVQPPDARSFPPELLLLVLELAYCQPSTSFSERRMGLCAAAVVSLDWLHPAQQLLWRSIEVRGTVRLKALRAICESKGRGAKLAAYTHKLAVASCPMHDVARLLKRLPRVDELHLERPPPDLPLFASFDLQIAVTRRPDVPKLTSLRVSFAPLELVHNLLSILPSLRFVEVHGSLGEVDDSPPPGPSPRCRLYELRWGVGSRFHAAHALSFSLDSLRILALHSLPPGFPDLMRIYGPRLRSLRVFRYDPSLPLAVRHCAVLEEFIMQDHIPPAELLAELPDSLEHLGIDGDYGHQRGLDAVSAWVTKRRLRVLTCFSPDVSDLDWPDFVRACQQGGVELRCFKGWHGLYENEDEELGEVDRFPRAVPYHAQRLLQPGLPSTNLPSSQ